MVKLLSSSRIVLTIALNFILSVPSSLRVGANTTLNIVLYAATRRRCLWLEGRVSGGVFRNWIGHFPYKPKQFFQPTTEEEIVELLKDPKTKSVRVFGAGHSFNDSVVSDEVLVSLDKFTGRVSREGLGKHQIAVKGGTRIRDVAKELLEERLAFRALPSHDAQSIGGILSTDVHGTGRIFGTVEENWGFVSQSVVSLRLIDGKGEVHECRPSDDLFKAAIGGIGAVGIITEVVVQGVPRFNVRQKFEPRAISFKDDDKEKFDELVNNCLRENDHFSLYVFPFTDRCQINTWNKTDCEQTLFGDLQEDVSISLDALLAAWFGNFIAYTGLLLLPRVSSWIYDLKKRGTDLVLESNKAFNRTIYHQHQELEFTVPFKDTFECCKSFKKLYKDLYPGLPYAFIEVRFTPDGHDRTLIGAGRDRRCTWIDLICNDSLGYEKYYAKAEELMKKIDARPHLGKFCKSFTQADMARLHSAPFMRFLTLVEEHDPDGKFANDFTRRLFGLKHS
jgi:hypothetical protein